VSRIRPQLDVKLVVLENLKRMFVFPGLIIAFSHCDFITIGNKTLLIIGGITGFLVSVVTFMGTLFLYFAMSDG
jgi:hypothetical protein